MMIRAVTVRYLSEPAALVEAPAVERDREGLQWGGILRGGEVQDCGRVQPTAEPDTHRHVRDQALTDGRPKTLGKFFQCLGLAPRPRLHADLPPRLRRHYPLMPFEPIARREFPHPIDERARPWHVVQ